LRFQELRKRKMRSSIALLLGCALIVRSVPVIEEAEAEETANIQVISDAAEQPDLLEDTISSIIDSVFQSPGLVDNSDNKGPDFSSSTTYYLGSNDGPMTVISMSSSDTDPLPMDSNFGGILGGMFGGDFFGGLFNNDMADMMSRFRKPRFGDEGTEIPVAVEGGEGVPLSVVTDLKSELKTMEDRVEELETLKALSDSGFAEATWGVNADQLRKTCMKPMADLCPESMPEVFFHELHQFPPPAVPHGGLAGSDPEAPCWMKCVDVHRSKLPYDCIVSADRMKAWLDAHDSDDYMGDPNMMLLGAMLHFLLMVLMISTCVRCTFVCLRMRRRRCVAKAAVEVAPKPVQAITIQIPSLGHQEDLVEATIVTGVEVSEK